MSLPVAIRLRVAQHCRLIVTATGDQRQVVAALEKLEPALQLVGGDVEGGAGLLLPALLFVEKVLIRSAVMRLDRLGIGLVGEQVGRVHGDQEAGKQVRAGHRGGGATTHFEVAGQIDFLEGRVTPNQLPRERLWLAGARQAGIGVAIQPTVVVMRDRVRDG